MFTSRCLTILIVLLAFTTLGQADLCELRGFSLFSPAALAYHDITPKLCPSRGQCLLSPKTDVTSFDPANGVTEVTLDTCIPDKRMLLTVFTTNHNHGNNTVATAATGDLFSVISNSLDLDFNFSVANYGWTNSNDNKEVCYGTTDYYANITNVAGTGALGESPSQRITTLHITVKSSTGSCDDRTYIVNVNNRDCVSYDAPSACLLTQITVREDTPLLGGLLDWPGAVLETYPLGGLPTGGLPIIANFPTTVTVPKIYLYLLNNLTFELFPDLESLVQITHYIYDTTTGLWNPTGFTTSVTLNPINALLPVLVPFDTTHRNKYAYNISSSFYLHECSVENLALEFSNPTGGFGDPQFVGLQGQSFQIHGYDGGVFNIISNMHFQMNSLFVFLTGPRPCPILPSGKKSAACWSHDGSYLGEIGIKTNKQDQIYIQSGSADVGFAQVTINGNQTLKVGETFEFEYDDMKIFGGLVSISNTNSNTFTGKITRLSTHELSIEISCFLMEIENVDSFVNVRRLSIPAQFRSSLSKLHPHGLLGQTWQSKRYSGDVKEIEGDVDDYVVEDGLFGDNFLFNQFAVSSA